MKRLIWVLVLALALCLTGSCMAEEAENAVDPRIEAFFDTWSCEGHAIEIWQEEDGSLSAYASSDISETEHYRWDYTGMTLDEAEGTLVCDGKGVKTHRTVVEGQDELQIEELAGDLSATFAINEKDQLVWTESGENAGEGLAYDRLDVAEAEMGEAETEAEPVEAAKPEAETEAVPAEADEPEAEAEAVPAEADEPEAETEVVLTEAAEPEAAVAESGEPAVDPRIEAFLETWSCDGHSIEIWQEEDGTLSAFALNAINESEDYRWEYEGLTFDEAAGTLVCDGQGVKTHNTLSDGQDEMQTEEVARDLSATFAINENDQLVWTESGENAGEGLTFVRLDVAEAEMGEVRMLRLGGSQFLVAIPESFVPGDLTEDDVADDQVGYFYSPETSMDFDVYQYPKTGLKETLSAYVIDEAGHFGNVSTVKTDEEINGIPAAWYRATDEYADEEYQILAYLLDDGDSYVKIVFWLDGDDAEAQADAIIQSLTTIELKELRLGSSQYFFKVFKSYESGELTEDDIAEGQVAYFASDESLVDFDVYQISKEGVADTLAQFVMDEAAKDEKTTEINTEYIVNGIAIAWYRSKDVSDDVEYETLNCIMDDDTNYVKVVFWMDGPSAQTEVNAIIKSLSKARAMKAALGNSGYTVTLPDGFRKGELKDTDLAIGHLSFYYDVDDTLEIDVYHYSKEDLGGSIGAYLESMAKDDAEVMTYEADASINDIPVAWCRYEAEYNGEAFRTISYFLDAEGEYVEISTLAAE